MLVGNYNCFFTLKLNQKIVTKRPSKDFKPFDLIILFVEILDTIRN